MSGGERKEIRYGEHESSGGADILRASFSEGGYFFEIEDITAERKDVPGVLVSRSIKARPEEDFNECSEGIMFEVMLPVELPPNCKWRFCSPSIDMTRPRKMVYKKRKTYQGEIESGNLFGAYNCDKHVMYSIYRSSMSLKGILIPKESTFKHIRQMESMAALGYEVIGRDELEFIISWPMATDYYLMDGSPIDIYLEYTILTDKAPTFSDGMFNTYKHFVYEVLKPDINEIKKERTDGFRQTKERLEGLYRRTENGPESFSGDSDVIGYGMGERNIKLALFMAFSEGGKWIGVLERMTDFFVSKCVSTSGFGYTSFDIKENRPVSMIEGNYVIAMTEAAFDVLRAYRFLKKRGINKPAWLELVRRYADYLIKIQNSDGSWYHAYDEEGNEVEIRTKEKVRFEVKDAVRKTGAGVPLSLISRLAIYLESINLNADEYKAAAILCAQYVIKNIVRFEMYLGADPDYPSAFAKDSAKYALMGLYNAYEMCGDEKYLEGAVSAAKLFVVWNNGDFPCDCVELYKLGLKTGEEIFTMSTYYSFMDFDIEEL